MGKLNKLGVENSLWNNIRAKKGSGKQPTKEMLKQEAKIKKEEKMKKTGGKKSSWLEDSKELKFGKLSKKYLDGGPITTPPAKMDPKEALGKVFTGEMTGAQANAATGFGNKPKKYTDAENIDNLKKVFSGTHVQDAQGNIVPKVKKTGGKKKMGGKKC